MGMAAEEVGCIGLGLHSIYRVESRFRSKRWEIPIFKVWILKFKPVGRRTIMKRRRIIRKMWYHESQGEKAS